ncbi:MAG TPA: serine/threonine-protein kinase [Polyangiaceae bacterium]
MPPSALEGLEIVEQLRAGPIADFYVAKQEPLGRKVFVKTLSPSILPSSPFAATLRREARLLASLDHPNVLRVHDFVCRDDGMWLILEYVDGWDLERVLKNNGKLEQGVAAAVALEVARALEHSHTHGIIHRDVQPRNVLLSRRGTVKLVNFAVATDERMPTAPELFEGESALVAPAYLSPEQILGEPADPRSDLFSLGVVLYQMLTGKLPFSVEDDRSTTQRIRHDAPPPLRRSVPGVLSRLERIVERCLEKLPNDRFASARELRKSLEVALEELGDASTLRWIARGLGAAGLGAEAPAAPSQRPPGSSILERPSLAPPLRGLFLGFLLIIAGGSAIQLAVPREQRGVARGAEPLELLPSERAYLRVVAEPWAHVSVDGQRVDTTPFAAPIPLQAGTHYVRLEHPNAPTERRTVQLTAGQTVLLDVKLEVIAPSPSVARDAAVPKADAQLEASPGP